VKDWYFTNHFQRLVLNLLTLELVMAKLLQACFSSIIAIGLKGAGLMVTSDSIVDIEVRVRWPKFSRLPKLPPFQSHRSKSS